LLTSPIHFCAATHGTNVKRSQHQQAVRRAVAYLIRPECDSYAQVSVSTDPPVHSEARHVLQHSNKYQISVGALCTYHQHLYEVQLSAQHARQRGAKAHYNPLVLV
jgi:hypothetical protein